MTWQERLENTIFQITTGDGEVWTPKWRPTGKSLEFNNSIYDYPNLEGSFVERREAKGEKYIFEILFEGEENITDGENFITSSKDKRAWRIVHPYFGNLTVQPVRLSPDPSTYNVYKIKIECIETIITEQPVITTSPTGVVTEIKLELDETIEASYANNIGIATSEDISLLTRVTNVVDRAQSAIIRGNQAIARFKNRVNAVLTVVDNVISVATSAIRAVVDLINYPFRLAQNLRDRFGVLREVFDTLLNSVTRGASLDPISDPDPIARLRPANRKEKVLFENVGASIISTMCVISIIEPVVENNDLSISEDDAPEYTLRQDYPSRVEITEQIARLRSVMFDYTTTLDELSTPRADNLESFVPDAAVQIILQRLVSETISNLEGQIFNSAQEMVVTLQDDSDIINITHRYLGLDSADVNIGRMIEVNNLSLNNILEVKKGTQIRYYV